MVRLPPQQGYLKAESEHFKIVFPKTLEQEAKDTLAIFEEVHKKLAPFWGYEKDDEKMTIIISDSEDFANGITSAIGRQGIILYLAPPQPYQSIEYYGHWLESLIIHEYTHYLTLNREKGVFKILKIFFGDLIKPNNLWPSWVAEGLAVFAESSFVNAGRGRSPFYQTLLKDALYRKYFLNEQNTILNFSELSGGIRPEFPFGESDYYYGFNIIEQLVYENDLKILKDFTEDSSYRLAWFLNGTLENVLTEKSSSRSFDDLHDRFYERKFKEYEEELNWFDKNKTPNFKIFNEKNESAIGAVLSPDGSKLVYFVQSPDFVNSLRLYDLEKNKEKILDKAVSGIGLDFSSDNKKIIYSKLDYDNPFYFYSDIYIYNLEKNKIKRLTYNERALDPSFCGSDTKVVYTSRMGRFSYLKILDLTTNTTQTLIQSKDYYQISNPRCDYDGKNIYFTEHSLNPIEAIFKFNLENKTTTHVIGGDNNLDNNENNKQKTLKLKPFRALFPEPSLDGYLYYTYVDPEIGSYDLARLNLNTHENEILMRSHFGFLNPRLQKNNSQNNIALTLFSSTGRKSTFINLNNLLNSKQNLNSYPINNKKKLVSAPKVLHQNSLSSQNKTPSLEINKNQYTFFHGLKPRFWYPSFFLNNLTTKYGLGLSGWDDVDSFEYSLFAEYDSATKKNFWSISTNLRVSTLRLNPYYIFEQSELYKTTSNLIFSSARKKFGFTLSRPFISPFSISEPFLIFNSSRNFFYNPWGNTFSPIQKQIGAGYIFNNQLEFLNSILPEQGIYLHLEGRRFFLKSKRSHKIGSQLNLLFPVYPKHASLMLNSYFSYNSKVDLDLPDSLVHVGGVTNFSSNLDLPLRGYAQGANISKIAVATQTEYRLPLAQVFSGYRTWPIFLKNLGLYTFLDSAQLYKSPTLISVGDRSKSPTLIGFGGGFISNFILGYHSPLQIKIEFAQGKYKDYFADQIMGIYLGAQTF